MSSPMGPPSGGGMPSGGGAPQRSVFNPTDGAVMAAKGEIGQGMTVGQYFERLGIKWGDPLETALQKIKGQVQGASPLGNLQMKGGGQPPAAGPAPMPAKPQSPAPAGLSGLMGR